MVLVVYNGDSDGSRYVRLGSGHRLIIFYTLTDNGGWQVVKTFDIANDLGVLYSVALSRSTAFIGFEETNDKAGVVHIYEQSLFGDWEKVEDLYSDNASQKLFGMHVDIDGDLACILDHFEYSVLLYRRVSNKWVQVDKIDGDWCSTSEDSIVTTVRNNTDPATTSALHLFKYNEDLDGLVSIQDPILTGFVKVMSTKLSGDYLVYLDTNEEAAFIYHRWEGNQTYSFHQRLITLPSLTHSGLAIDNEIIAIRGSDHIHIFSLQYGKWEEAVTLHVTSLYHQLSGWTLFTATEKEVFTFIIEDCAQKAPTQTPS